VALGNAGALSGLRVPCLRPRSTDGGGPNWSGSIVSIIRIHLRQAIDFVLSGWGKTGNMCHLTHKLLQPFARIFPGPFGPAGHGQPPDAIRHAPVSVWVGAVLPLERRASAMAASGHLQVSIPGRGNTGHVVEPPLSPLAVPYEAEVA